MSKYKIKVKIKKQNKKTRKLKEQIKLLMRNTDDMSYASSQISPATGNNNLRDSVRFSEHDTSPP